MACNLLYDDSPMTAVQLFNYILHRYPDLGAYFLRDRDLLVIPLTADNDEIAQAIRELSVRKGLNCSQVCAAWPELLDPGVLDLSAASEFLVISEIRGKYSTPC